MIKQSDWKATFNLEGQPVVVSDNALIQKVIDALTSGPALLADHVILYSSPGYYQRNGFNVVLSLRGDHRSVIGNIKPGDPTYFTYEVKIPGGKSKQAMQNLAEDIHDILETAEQVWAVLK